MASCQKETTVDENPVDGQITQHKWQSVEYSKVEVDGVEYLIFTTVNSGGSSVSIDVVNHSYQKYLLETYGK